MLKIYRWIKNKNPCPEEVQKKLIYDFIQYVRSYSWRIHKIYEVICSTYIGSESIINMVVFELICKDQYRLLR